MAEHAFRMQALFRRLNLFFLWLGMGLALAGIFPQAASSEQWSTVRWVDDGDTVVLENNDRVRYIGIDCPEIDHEDRPGEPYGYLAKSCNKQLVYGKKVRLEYDQEKRDRHGRLLAYLFLSDGRLVNGLLLAQGFAYCSPHAENAKYRDLLLTHQRQAMSAKSGIWKEFKESGTEYAGNRLSWRFHQRECPLAKNIAKHNRIRFKTKWDAFWNGFAPDKNCLNEYWKQ